MEFGDAAQTAAKKSFHAACILFFYSDHLTKKYSAVSNALHAAWKYQFKKVMQPDDLKRPPLIYEQEETNWCAATIDFLERQLTDDERVARGLPQRRASTRNKTAAPAAARKLIEDDDDLDDARLSRQLMRAYHAPAFFWLPLYAYFLHNQHIEHNQHILHNQHNQHIEHVA
jgi:hypothetical protein